MGVQSIEMYAFSYFSDRAIDMGLIGKTYSVVIVNIHTSLPHPLLEKGIENPGGVGSQFKSNPNWNFHR